MYAVLSAVVCVLKPPPASELWLLLVRHTFAYMYTGSLRMRAKAAGRVVSSLQVSSANDKRQLICRDSLMIRVCVDVCYCLLQGAPVLSCTV